LQQQLSFNNYNKQVTHAESSKGEFVCRNKKGILYHISPTCTINITGTVHLTNCCIFFIITDIKFCIFIMLLLLVLPLLPYFFHTNKKSNEKQLPMLYLAKVCIIESVTSYRRRQSFCNSDDRNHEEMHI